MRGINWSVRYLSCISRHLHVLALAGACLLLAVVAAESGPPEGEGPGVEFTLGDAAGFPGDTLVVDFGVQATVPLPMVSWSVEFDPSVLQFEKPALRAEIQELLKNRPDKETSFEWFADNEAGWLQVSVVSDFFGREGQSIPPAFLGRLAVLQFRVQEDAPPGFTPVVFARDGKSTFEGNFRGSEGEIVYNAVRDFGRAFGSKDLFNDVLEPELDDGGIVVQKVIGKIGIFRGDANADLAVNISDSLTVFNHLFVSGKELPCPEAADVNTDQTIDISDGILILDYLFTGLTNWSPSAVEVDGESPDGCRA